MLQSLYISVYISVYTISVYISVYVYMFIYVFIYIFIYVYITVYICLYKCLYLFIYLFIQLFIFFLNAGNAAAATGHGPAVVFGRGCPSTDGFIDLQRGPGFPQPTASDVHARQAFQHQPSRVRFPPFHPSSSFPPFSSSIYFVAETISKSGLPSDRFHRLPRYRPLQ